jgi:hypothetical protein
LTNKRLHTIKYRGLQEIDVFSLNDWYKDQSLPRNLVHHLMSLRWLGEIKEFELKKTIIKDFITYHSTSKKLSKFYLGGTADHSASIRLKFLFEMLDDDRNLVPLDDLTVVRNEIHKTLDSCVSGQTYKEAHNHGLMVDLALISALDQHLVSSRHKKILTVVPSRIIKQLKAIFR